MYKYHYPNNKETYYSLVCGACDYIFIIVHRQNNFVLVHVTLLVRLMFHKMGLKYLLLIKFNRL